MAEEEIVEQPIEEEAPLEEQPEPSQPTEETVEPQEPEGDPEPSEPAAEVTEEKPPSRRESLRIQQLLQKIKEEPRPERKPEGGLDYGKELEADPEVIAKLEADRRAVGQAEYHKGLEQAKSIQFHTRLEIDAPRVESKFPQLNRESDQFDPVIADAINQHYLHLVGYDASTDTVQNPNLRYADFVEAQYELAGALASQQVEKTSKNIAKQAATTGLRPDGSAAKSLNLNKAPQDMSEDELKAVIGQTIK